MNPRVLAPPYLPELVPPLFADRHLVILTPATAHTEWAAGAAWAVARAAATGERSVLLVDLSADGPVLDGGANGVAARGIADVFLADEPLTDAARPQDATGLHFIRRGDAAGGFVPIWSHPRWQRLARGFAAERALLLLFAPPAALPHLPVDPDGIVVLAPNGYDPVTGTFPHLARRLAQGTPLLAIVAERTPPQSAPGSARGSGPVPRPPLRSPSRQRQVSPRTRRVTATLVAVGAILSAVAVWAGRPARDGRAAPAPGVPRLAAPPEADAAAADSLFYSVQVAAFNTADQAMARALDLDDGGVPGIVTPIRMGGPGLWYRVLAGTLPTARAADSLRRALWQAGRVERPMGTILRTPEAYRVGRRQDRREAAAAAADLRTRGIPAYIVGAPDGTARVYVGAFDLPEQAQAVDSLLSAAGITGTLVQRMGITP